jgi:metal-dependent amidase/aminoacylase/carboxypeptidase family protein
VGIVHELCQKFGLYRQAENSWTKSRTAHRLTGNLQRFGFEKVTKVETLREIIEEMGEETGTGQNSQP